MDKGLFTDNKLGKLIKINIQEASDWAFVPAPLPSKWEVPIDLWPLLSEAREELARLDGIGRHMPNYELLLKPLQKREALKSSSLEGTHATPEQLLIFEINPREPKSDTARSNEWREVFNYSRALRLGQKLIEDIPVSKRLIKSLHKSLLTGVRGQQRSPGDFRKSQVHIGSDRRFIPPPPLEAIQCLNELEEYIHSEVEIDPLIFCFMVHYQFEAIHPFLDGNGRVGRLLLSLMIFKWNKLNSPWLYLSAFFDKYKEEYISNLFNVSTKGDWSSWIAYCLRATIFQAKDAIKRCDKLVALREKYISNLSQCGGNVRLNQLIDMLFESPVITIPEVSKKLNISYPTAKSDVKILCKSGILSKNTREERPKLFFAIEIFKIAFSDPDG